MTRWAPWYAALIAILAPACGGSSSDDEQEGSAATPECQAMTSTWCDRAIGCLVEVGSITEADLAENLDVCADVAFASARCEDAVAVGASYDQCLADIRAKPCSDWNVPLDQLATVTPPNSCVGVILLP